MRLYCTLRIGGVLHERQATELATVLASFKPYCMKGNATPEWAFDKLCNQENEDFDITWDFESVQDGILYPDLKALMETFNLDWAWCINDTDSWKITIHTHLHTGEEDSFHLDSDSNQICLPVNALTQERISVAQTWQAWLDTLTLRVTKSAHETLHHLADEPAES